MSKKIARRTFLKASAASATAAGYFLTASVTESAERRADDPMRRLNVACIGCGGQGHSNVGGVSRENIVALCDVDSERASRRFNEFPKAPKYTDFRVMLEKQKDIEAVTVSTADHTHAVAAMMAIQMGKHVYCEKPLTHSVWEARQLRLAAVKHRVATQMGNQGTSSDGLRTGVEIVRSGAIGDVREVHVWTDRPGRYWRQGHRERPKGQPVPKTLAWDVWLGPAPERPYNSAYHPFAWRGWWDFGTGALGDMACHIMNLPYMALELGAPSSVVAEIAPGETINNESPPNGLVVTYEFPARGTKPAVRLKWYEVRRPPLDLFEGVKALPGGGSLMIGSKGKLYSGDDYGSGHTLWPSADFKGYRPPKPTLPRSPGHHAEWIRACKGGAAAMSNFDYSARLTEMVLLGNVAIRIGKRIVWDADKLRCIDCAAADEFVRPTFRKGWGWTPLT